MMEGTAVSTGTCYYCDRDATAGSELAPRGNVRLRRVGRHDRLFSCLRASPIAGIPKLPLEDLEVGNPQEHSVGVVAQVRSKHRVVVDELMRVR